MQKRCCNCFELFEDFSGMCPFCGYSIGDKTEEAYYLQPGTGLRKEKYIIGEKVGQGGFGIIYKAWDTNLQRLVAIKEFFPSSMVTRGEGQKEIVVFSSKREGDYQKHLNKFRREAKIMSLFTDSTNCIKTYDVFEENGTAYIVMEYCNAPTLKSYIKERKGGLLPESEIITIISQVLQGVEELHAKGVYHLDIALDNIFIKKDEDSGQISVIIYDFGAARLERGHRLTMEEEDIILKPGFAPPEQYKKNGKLGPWTDIYAVGANLYYLLTGIVPEESTDREHEDHLAEPATINMVSPAINNATMRAMALNPELRYQSAREFLEDLQKENVRSLKEELHRRKRKRTRILVFASILFVVASAALVFWGYVKGDIRETELTMWVLSNTDEAETQKQYEEILLMFHEYYPQVTVKLEIFESEELNRRFIEASDKERPDIFESTYATEPMLRQCRSISRLLKENRSVFIRDIAEQIVSAGAKQFPLGIYVSVIYKQANEELTLLNKAENVDFLKNANGYIESDTTVYSMIQKLVAGKYEVVPGYTKEVYLTKKFSVFSKGINREKAAKALLEYMLTDRCQEKLHITYRSDYIPISQSMFDLYVGEVFSELGFLQNTLKEYEVKEGE